MEEREHLPLEELLSLSRQSPGSVAARRFSRHLARCGVCRAEFALIRAFESVPADASLGLRSGALRKSFLSKLRDARGRVLSGEEDHPGAPSPVRPTLSASKWRSPSVRHWVTGGLVAASLAFMIIGGVGLLHRPSPSELGGTLRSAPVTTQLHIEVGSGIDGWRVTWTAVGGLHDYSLQVIDASGETLLERRAEAPPLQITAEMLPPSTRGPLFLRIHAIDASGELVRSNVVRLP